ncbi:unnamed protein product [Prorocentrum cordatum]|uniref:Uncharacterized protein n=1 Tax=Prorocentrum cordatum TaxID=2364126 RepID=A0ABN9WSJ7_9DINO|nr:unnamed protein product [Polarella glacialis]
MAGTRPPPRDRLLSALAWAALLAAAGRLPCGALVGGGAARASPAPARRRAQAAGALPPRPAAGGSGLFVGGGAARAAPAPARRRAQPVDIVPGRRGGPCIIVISDSTGDTAKFLFSRALETYDSAQRPGVTLYSYVTKPMELAEILAMETSHGYSELYVVATLVEPSMIRWIEKLSVDMGIQNLNLMKPMLDEFNLFLGSKAEGKAGATDSSSSIVMQQLDDLVSKEFLGMVDAANFVRSRSDARRPADWHEADIILVGVSRCGKTSVASFLAQRGKKTACVRIGAGKPMPEGLGTADPSKVVLVTRSADHILRRRKKRVSLWMSKSISPTLPHSLDNYATPDKVHQDLEVFSQLAGSHPEWMGPLDCTYACEDETASLILDALAKRAALPSGTAAPAEDPAPSLPLLSLVPAALALGFVLGEAGKALGEGRLAAAARPPWGGRGGSLLAGVRTASGSRLRVPGARVAAQRQDLHVRSQEAAAMRSEVGALAQRGAEGGAGKCVYLLSDDSGEAAQLLLSRLLVQYVELESPSVVVFTQLDSVSRVRSIVAQAQSSQQDVFVLATLRQRSLSDALAEFGGEMGVRTHNAMAGLQRVMTLASSSVATEELVFMDQLIFDGSTDSLPADGSTSGIKKAQAVDSDFFLMAEAVQFAQQHISGVNSREWADADVLLVGPSRVGKETVACYLAQRGVKVACFTAADERAPPALSSVDPRKVVFLTMSCEFLLRRRENQVQQLKRMGLPAFYDAGYTNCQLIENELDSVVRMAHNQRGSIGPIDISDYDIVEVCDIVLSALKHASIEASSETVRVS